MLKLRAQITIDIDAADFVSAADHQRRVESFIDHIREVYSHTDLVLKERRAPVGPAEPRPMRRSRKYTGKLNTYAEA